MIRTIEEISIPEGVKWEEAKYPGKHNVVRVTSGPVEISVDGNRINHRVVYKVAADSSVGSGRLVSSEISPSSEIDEDLWDMPTLSTEFAPNDGVTSGLVDRGLVLTNPQRQARVFQEINSGRFCALYQGGWVSEYIQGEQASDSEIADGLLELYRNKRRLVLDPHVKGNALVTQERSVAFVDVDFALRRGSIDSDRFLFESNEKMEENLTHLSDLYLRHDCGGQQVESSTDPDQEVIKFYPDSLAVTLGLLYLEKSLQSEAIVNDWIEKSVIMAIFQAYQLHLKISPNILKGFLFLRKIGRLQKLLSDSGMLRQFFCQDQVGHVDSLVPVSALFDSSYESIMQKYLPKADDGQELKPEGLLLGLDCSVIGGKLRASAQGAKLRALSEYIDQVKKTGFSLINSQQHKALNKDRTAGSGVARVIAMILINTALLLMCLIGLGAALFCWQKKRTGHTCWFFTETKTCENLRIAQTSITRAAARIA